MKAAAFGLTLIVFVTANTEVAGQAPIQACPAPHLSTSSWKAVHQDLFTFRLPPGFDEVPIHGSVDSWVRQFESADSSVFVTFDWGYYSDPLTNRSPDQYQQFSSCEEKIGGRLARVVALYPEGAERGAEFHPEGAQSQLFGAGAAWRDVQHGIHLTFYGWARDRNGLDQLLRIFRTVRFK